MQLRLTLETLLRLCVGCQAELERNLAIHMLITSICATKSHSQRNYCRMQGIVDRVEASCR